VRDYNFEQAREMFDPPHQEPHVLDIGGCSGEPD
jgi:hypothetical protein